MEAQRWRQIEALFEAVQGQPPEQRSSFLAKACLDDSQLRAEVQSLLDQDANSFLESAPVFSINALTAGTKLGNFEVVELLGRGGIGEVWRATDTKLRRDVAIKVLASGFAQNSAWMSRFEREARVLAALNHPHIAAIYGLEESGGVHAIAMEVVEGPTLAERMQSGRIPIPEALAITRQIAEALEYAHEKGVVHRDLKPANVKLRPDGVVKVLDFGLAKAAVSVRATKDEPMETATRTGVILGTPAYMAPEQAAGLPVDRRADVWSFGVMLFEMLAGRKIYARKTTLETLAALARDEVPWDQLPAETPTGIVWLLRRSLDRDVNRRLQNIGEARIAIEAALAGDNGMRSQGNGPRPKTWHLVALIVVLVFAVVATFELVAWLRVPKREGSFTPVPLVSLPGCADFPAFSADGNRVAFAYGCDANKSGIYVKQVGGGPPVPLTTASEYAKVGAGFTTWSPDDRNIAFVRGPGKDGAVMLVPAVGGRQPRELAKIDAISLCWAPDSRWLVLTARDSAEKPYAIWLLSAETGERRRLVTPLENLPNLSDALTGDFAGSLSPDGRTLVFLRTLGTFNGKLFAIPVSSDLRSESPPRELTDQTITNGFGRIDWIGEREIVFSASGGLYRMPVSGASPMRLNWAAGSIGAVAISRLRHRLAYGRIDISEPLWRLDLRSGEFRKIVDSSYNQQIPQYSPDGRRIAFQSNSSGELGLWTCDADGANCQQLTSFKGSVGGSPRWSPDGRFVTFDSREEGHAQIYVMPSGGGPHRRLTSGTTDNQVPSWSRDGHWVYFESERSGEWLVWKAPATGGEAVQVTHTEGGAAFESADGKSLYFVSERTKALFRVPVNGGQEKLVAPAVCRFSGFSVTARGVYFLLDERTLQLLDEETGRIRTVARLGEHAVSNGMAVSPDGAYMVFAEFARTRDDLMLVEGFR